MARPTKLTPETAERIVAAIRAGNYVEAAARSAGIAASTFYRWMDRGRDESTGMYRELYESVKRAEGEAEVHAVAVVRRAMSEDWRAALAYLERRHPSRWQRRQATELTGKDGAPLGRPCGPQIDLSSLTDQELALLKKLQHDAPPGPDER